LGEDGDRFELFGVGERQVDERHVGVGVV